MTLRRVETNSATGFLSEKALSFELPLVSCDAKLHALAPVYSLSNRSVSESEVIDRLFSRGGFAGRVCPTN